MIVLYNPHVDDFLAEPPHFRLLGRRALKKYGFIIEETLRQFGYLDVVLDGTMSAFIPDRFFHWLPKRARDLVARLEFRYWQRINGLRGKVRFVGRSTGEQANRCLLVFSYKAAIGRFEQRLESLSAFPIVLVHLSHYFISTAEKAANLRNLRNARLAGDSDISANPYFRAFFGWYSAPFVVLPFAVAPRFQVRKPFCERQAKCLATGSFHNLEMEVPAYKYRDFMDFFRTNTYHPLRKLVYENAKALADVVVCHVSPYRGDIVARARLKRWLRYFSVSQKSYFALDIVDLYNRYRFATVGEEASGFPALGAFEAMACGALLVAQPSAYAGLPLQPERHFLTHNGSIDGLVSAVEQARADERRACLIADAGKELIDEQFRPTAAYRRLRSAIDELQTSSRVP